MINEDLEPKRPGMGWSKARQRSEKRHQRARTFEDKYTAKGFPYSRWCRKCGRYPHEKSVFSDGARRFDSIICRCGIPRTMTEYCGYWHGGKLGTLAPKTSRNA